MRDSRLSRTVWPYFLYPSKKRKTLIFFLRSLWVELIWLFLSAARLIDKNKRWTTEFIWFKVQGWSSCTWNHKVGIFSTTQEVIFSVNQHIAPFSDEINNISRHRRKPTRESFVSMLSMMEDFNCRKYIKWQQGTKDTSKWERKKE